LPLPKGGGFFYGGYLNASAQEKQAQASEYISATIRLACQAYDQATVISVFFRPMPSGAAKEPDQLINWLTRQPVNLSTLQS